MNSFHFCKNVVCFSVPPAGILQHSWGKESINKQWKIIAETGTQNENIDKDMEDENIVDNKNKTDDKEVENSLG